jgi:hypothetical protein
MIHFPRLSVGNAHYQLHELTFGQSIKVAKIPERLNEQRITAFLAAALKDDELPLSLPVQVRYWLLLQYLSAQSGTLIDAHTDYAPYLISSDAEWATECVSDDGLVVRQLTGLQSEVIEQACEDVADRVLGAMAFQILDHSGLDPLPASPTTQNLWGVLMQRAEVLRDLPESVFDALFEQYQWQSDRMATLLRTGFDNDGLVVFGGAANQAARFRPATAFGFVATQLAGHFPDQSAAAIE